MKKSHQMIFRYSCAQSYVTSQFNNLNCFFHRTPHIFTNCGVCIDNENIYRYNAVVFNNTILYTTHVICIGYISLVLCQKYYYERESEHTIHLKVYSYRLYSRLSYAVHRMGSRIHVHILYR